MDVDEYAPLFVPFPSQSVTILSSSTNSGKTSLLCKILENKHLYFSDADSISRAVVVLCNSRVDSSAYSDLDIDGLEINIFYLDSFQPHEDLKPKDILIFEDVDVLYDQVRESINVLTHHLDLSALFVVVQSLFGSLNSDFRNLLVLVHKLILFPNRGTARMRGYLSQYFFSNSELKTYVEQVFLYAEKNNDILLLDLNETKKEDTSNYFAISGLDHFFDESNKPIVIFPNMYKRRKYEKNVDHSATADVQFDLQENDFYAPPPGTYVLVPSKNVHFSKIKTAKNTDETGIQGGGDIANERWMELNRNAQNMIKLYIPFNKLSKGLALTSLILKCNDFTIVKSAELMWVTGYKSTSVPFIDFVRTAIRKAGVIEKTNEIFVLFAGVFIKNNLALSFFENKLLLKTAAAEMGLKNNFEKLLKYAKIKK